MEFINWGSESPEQLSARRKVEEQMLWEQAVRAARTRGNSTAPGVGGGIAKRPEVLPEYCAGDKTMITHTLFFFDLLSPDAAFDNHIEDSEVDSNIRMWRAAWHQAECEDIESEFFYKRPKTAVYPGAYNFPATTMYPKLVAASCPVSGYCNNVFENEDWVYGGSDIEMPGVTYINTLTAVADESALPLTGSPGDVVWNIGADAWYAWDKNLTLWSTAYYSQWFGNVHGNRSSVGNTNFGKNDLSYATYSLLMAAKYIPDYVLKKNNL